jgi:hypothetical protein
MKREGIGVSRCQYVIIFGSTLEPCHSLPIAFDLLTLYVL